MKPSEGKATIREVITAGVSERNKRLTMRSRTTFVVERDGIKLASFGSRREAERFAAERNR